MESQEHKCLFSGCKAEVTVRAYQVWNGKTVYFCAKHGPAELKDNSYYKYTVIVNK